MVKDKLTKIISFLASSIEELTETLETTTKALKMFEEGVGLINDLSLNLKEARGKISRFSELLQQEEEIGYDND